MNTILPLELKPKPSVAAVALPPQGPLPSPQIIYSLYQTRDEILISKTAEPLG